MRRIFGEAAEVPTHSRRSSSLPKASEGNLYILERSYEEWVRVLVCLTCLVLRISFPSLCSFGDTAFSVVKGMQIKMFIFKTHNCLTRHCGRVVKACDLNPVDITSLRRHRFKSCR